MLEKTASGHTVRLDVDLDGTRFTPYAADGLIVVFTSTETEELRELADELVTMRDGETIAHHASPPATSVIVRETTHDEEPT